MSIKVKIEGKEYYFTGDNFEQGGDIAYPHQVDEDGELKPFTMFDGNSFAHYYPDKGVLRYGVLIMSKEDFIKSKVD